MKIVFASNNEHKLEEVKSILGEHYEVLSLKDLSYSTDLPETTGTIPGNARQKAEKVFQDTGLNCFADDSGLEVEALAGEPGVDSAHYAGPQRDSTANINKLLQKLKGESNRTANFITVIAYSTHEGTLLFEGRVNGTITESVQGEGGFGYDPIFIPKGYDKSFAELDASIKNQISHRANALKLIKEYFEKGENK